MLSIDDLPKFGPMGAEPPLTSKPVVISVAFFGAALDKPSPQAAEAIRLLVSDQAEVDSRFPEPVAWVRQGSHQLQLYKAQHQDPKKIAGRRRFGVRSWVGVVAASFFTLGIPAIALGAWVGIGALRSRIVAKLDKVEVRRVIYSQRWVRVDPAMQIPPGGKRTFSSSRTVGISSTKSKELSRALGFPHTGGVDLGIQISERIQTTVTVHKEQADTETQEFSNDRSGYYRRVACWYVQHEFAVDALIAPSASASSPAAQAQSLQWAPRGSASFISPYAGHSTYADVGA